MKKTKRKNWDGLCHNYNDQCDEGVCWCQYDEGVAETKEMYKCPSYFDDDNVLRDCSCGKCGKDNICAYCGENKQENPLKHIAEVAEFLQKQIRECQKILNKL